MKPPRRLFRDRERGPIVPVQTPVPAPALSRFVVLVPFMDTILHYVDDGLKELERLGVGVCRRPGCSAIDFIRCAMASAAIMEGKEAVLFIDSDILFNPKDAVRLLLRPEPIVAGVYSQKQHGKLNLNPLPCTTEIAYGDQGRDYEVKGVGAGFLRIRTEAFKAIAEHFDMPCATGTGSPVWPFFMPVMADDPDDGQTHYLCEDYAFAWRARQAGLKVIVDTTVHLHHLGLYPYGFLEAGTPKVTRPRGGVIPVNFPKDGGSADP